MNVTIDRHNFGILMIMIGAGLHTQFGLVIAAALIGFGYVLTRQDPVPRLV